METFFSSSLKTRSEWKVTFESGLKGNAGEGASLGHGVGWGWGTAHRSRSSASRGMSPCKREESPGQDSRLHMQRCGPHLSPNVLLSTNKCLRQGETLPGPGAGEGGEASIRGRLGQLLGGEAG